MSPTVFFGWPGESQSALVASLSPDRIDGQRRAASPSQRRRAEERKDAHCRPWHPWRNTPPPGQMVLRDNRALPRSGTFDEGHPIPARRTWGGSRGPQRPVKLHLRPGAKKPLVSSHPSSLAQVYHFVFITPPRPCLPDPTRATNTRNRTHPTHTY